MIQNIPIPQLDTWKKNFADSSLGNETKSAVVNLSILKAFIADAEKNTAFNAVRIYFIRYDDTDGLNAYPTYIKPCIKGINLSQVSLAFVPVKDFVPETLMGEDIVEANKILTLAICHPTLDYNIDTITNTPIAKGTGLCPPRCPH